MKIVKPLLLLLAVTMLFTACDKEDDANSGDLTTSILVHYIKTAECTDITVNKIDDTHVSIQLETHCSSSTYSVAFTNVTMNTATSFTLNSVIGDDYCGPDQTYSGTGTHSGDNISLFITIDGLCGGTESVSGTRQ